MNELKRPKRINEEDEDELLRFQEEFLKNKSSEQPAAKVIRLNSKAIQSTVNQNDQKEKKKIEFDLNTDKQALETVLTDVIERTINKEFLETIGTSKNVELVVEKINIDDLNSKLSSQQRKNKSLFAQNLELKGKLKSHYQLDRVYEVSKVLNSNMDSDSAGSGGHVEKLKALEKCLPSKTRLITGEGLGGNTKDINEIHVENLQRLAQMTPDEILAEQRKYLEQLDPKLVAFIRRRNEMSSTSDQANATDRKETSKEENKINTDELLEELGMKPYKSWLQMEKIEFEKLEWMLSKSTRAKRSNDDTSSSTAEGTATAAARFDFSGALLAPDADVSVKSGLYHHGNDPESPGYTLDELFMLARSKFTQQRVLALQTLANIVTKCHSGAYYEHVMSGAVVGENKNVQSAESSRDKENNLIYQLVDGGLLLLLRLSLDDQTESVIGVALEGFTALLQPPGQEEAFDRDFDLDRSARMDCLHPFSAAFDESRRLFNIDMDMQISEKRELSELKDDEYIKQDLAGGLMRMNLIERFVYLVDKYSPQFSFQQITRNIFSILFRLMRHSAEFSYEFIKKYSSFVDLLVVKFLPVQMSGDGDIDNTVNTLKFIRLLASTGPTLAQKLYKNYGLKEKILTYLSCEGHPNQDRLYTESIRLLKILLTFANKNNSNCGIDCFYDCYEILLKKLSSSLNESSKHETVAASLTTLFNIYLRNETTNFDLNSSIFCIVSTYAINMFKKGASMDSLNLAAISLFYLVDYLEKYNEERNTKLDALIPYFIDPFVNESDGVLILERLVLSTMQANSMHSEANRDLFRRICSNNLSYLPTIMLTSTRGDQTFRFMTSYVRFLNLASLRAKTRRLGDVRLILGNDYIKSYLRMFTRMSTEKTSEEVLRNRQENLFVYYTIKLVFHLSDLEDCLGVEKKFYYQLALSLLPRLKHGDEYIIHDLISTCLFNHTFWSFYLNADANVENVLIRHLETLKLSDRLNLNASSLKSVELTHMFDCLNQIKLAYLDKENGALIRRRALEHARSLNESIASAISTIFLSPRYSGRFVLPVDWMFLPIISAIETKVATNKSRFEEKQTSHPTLLSTIANSLKYIYLLEAYLSTEYMDSHVTGTRRFIRLMYIYLLDDADIYLDAQVRQMMLLIYVKYATVGTRPVLTRLDLESSPRLEIDGNDNHVTSLLSFEDLYKAVLAAYDSCSFGDYVFSLYLIVPLQMIYASKYRQLFWSEYSHLFKYLKFDTASTRLPLSLKNFTEPRERSLHMIRLYTQILLDPTEFQHVAAARFGYSILIAHLNSFIYEHVNASEKPTEYEFKRLLIKQFMALSSERVRNDLIYFKCFSSDDDIELYDELPPIRKKWIEQFTI